MKAALLLGAILIGGVAAGLVVERAGLVSLVSDTTYIAALDEVPFFACPETAVLGDLHRGDRVFVTGRSLDGEWVEIRAPYDTGSRVWVEIGWLTPDSNLQAVPGVDCELSDVDAAGEPLNTTTTTTTTPLPDDAPTSSSSSSSVATSTSSTFTTTSTSTTTTSTTQPGTTVPADNDGPVIDFFQSTESELSESIGECFKPRTADISAVVFDSSGIGSVQLSWSVGTASGNTSVPRLVPDLDIYSVTIGPFSAETLSGGNAPIALTLTALDTLSNPTSVSSSSLVQLFDCGN